MLLPYLHILNTKKIILGSQSKSRNELLQTQKLKYERISSTFEEDLDKKSFESSQAYNLETCRGKVIELLARFKAHNIQWDLLICGDTIVEHKGQIIEKPVDQKHCIEMMAALTNQTHKAYTAHILTFNTQPPLQYQWVTQAEVTFGNIPLESLEAFAKTPEPYIHSGGYELSAISGSYLKSINGSHTAVQGLDIHELCNKIIEGSKKVGWIN